MKSVVVLILIPVCGCNGTHVEVKNDGPPLVDYDGDGNIGFGDLERGYPPQGGIDVQRDLSEHMDRQSKDYRERRD